MNAVVDCFTNLVGIIGLKDEPGCTCLFSALEHAFPVRFEKRNERDLDGLDAVIVRNNKPDFDAWTRFGGLPFYVHQPPADRKNSGSTSVQFSDSRCLADPFRQQCLPTPEAQEAGLLDSIASQEVLARVDGAPVWTCLPGDGTLGYRVAMPLPQMKSEERLSDFLNGDYFLKLLPLYHFLRALTKDQGWQMPGLRACMIVDDPNLRWTSYGCIDYEKLLSLAKDRRFHVSMAMVPLDASWVGRGAARLFRENPEQLSLLPHGNNHIRDELAKPLSADKRINTLSQALQRIDNLEQATRTTIPRIMVPPHGTCTIAFLSTMLQLGFEGCVTNRWCLWKFNDRDMRPVSVALELADMLAGGLPVLNRFRIKSKICAAEIAISAFLGQPLIPSGHHKDFKNAFKDVIEVVERINRLEGVRWMNMRDILKTNFLTRIANDTMQVMPYSRKIELCVPETVKALEVFAPFPVQERAGGFRIHIQAAGTQNSLYHFGEPVSVNGPCKVTVELEFPKTLDYRTIKTNGHPIGAVLHRLAAETRDRLRI